MRTKKREGLEEEGWRDLLQGIVRKIEDDNTRELLGDRKSALQSWPGMCEFEKERGETSRVSTMRRVEGRRGRARRARS